MANETIEDLQKEADAADADDENVEDDNDLNKDDDESTEDDTSNKDDDESSNDDDASDDDDKSDDESSEEDKSSDSTDGDSGEESTEPAAWQAQGKGDQKTDPLFHQYKSIPELMEAHKKLLESAPGEVAETIEDYKLELPEELPQEIERFRERVSDLKEHFLSQGITPKQAQGLVDAWVELEKTEYSRMLDMAKKNIEKAANELKKDWRGKEYKANMELAKRAYQLFGGDDFNKLMKLTPKALMDAYGPDVLLGNITVFPKTFAEIGRKVGDPEWIEGNVPALKGESKNDGLFEYENSNMPDGEVW